MKTWQEKAFDLIDDFLTVRSVITLGAFITVYLFVWKEKPVPDVIKSIVDLLLGYWFGSKIAKTQQGDGK